MGEAMTHADLVARAARWLANTRRCSVVATERNAWGAGEAPDAIGWTCYGHSVLVECKTTVADFYSDQRKPGRRAGSLGMGRERFYLTPEGLLAGKYLPDGWGLLELRGRSVRVIAHAAVRVDPHATCREAPLLVAIVRRGLDGRFPGLLAGARALPDAGCVVTGRTGA
jgi:hypothetical protein